VPHSLRLLQRVGVLTFPRLSNNLAISVKQKTRHLRIYVQEDVRHHDDIHTLVHFVRPVLTAGSPGSDRLPLRLAAVAAVPHSRHRSRRRPRSDPRNHLPPRTHAAAPPRLALP
jgi:hypothetical protein